MNLFWTVWLPLLLIAIIWYGYNTGGFVSGWIQRVTDPLLRLGSSILNFIFGL